MITQKQHIALETKQLADMFKDLDDLIKMQQPTIDSIEDYIYISDNDIEIATIELDKVKPSNKYKIFGGICSALLLIYLI